MCRCDALTEGRAVLEACALLWVAQLGLERLLPFSCLHSLKVRCFLPAWPCTHVGRGAGVLLRVYRVSCTCDVPVVSLCCVCV